jgi:UDPglucose 6-dehydrogenase
VPTPQGEDGAANLRFLEQAVKAISPLLEPGTVVVNKSTVPVGTAKRVSDLIGRNDVAVVSNPEFLRQGSALEDFLHPSRIVVGGEDPLAVRRVAQLYESVGAPVISTTSAAAELMKYAANSFLATKLTFINAIADLCEVVGADVKDVVAGLGSDSRIGSEFLNPGPGWGGSCFPKDTRALVSIADSFGYDFSLLRGVIATNDSHYDRVAQKVRDACGGSVRGKVVAALGLTFKANTDDLRDSPAVAILSQLAGEGAIVLAYDPAARGVDEVCPWATRVSSSHEAIVGSDVVAVLTEWQEFHDVDPEEFVDHVSTRTVVDGRNVLDRERWVGAGFTYRGVGR